MGIHPTIEIGTIGMWDTMIVMIMALVVFGPRRLPTIGRQIGKLMYEFRKASNDFRYQMEEELRNAEEADRRQREEAERQRALAAAPVAQIQASTQVEELQPAELAGETQEYATGASDESDHSGAYDEAMYDKYRPETEIPEAGAEGETDALRVQPPSTGAPVPAASPSSRVAVPPAAPAPELSEPVAAESLPSGDEAAVAHSEAVTAEVPAPQYPPEREARAETEPAAHHG